MTNEHILVQDGELAQLRYFLGVIFLLWRGIQIWSILKDIKGRENLVIFGLLSSPIFGQKEEHIFKQYSPLDSYKNLALLFLDIIITSFSLSFSPSKHLPSSFANP